MFNLNNIIKSKTGVALGALLMCFSISALVMATYTDPTAGPPNGNVAPPISTEGGTMTGLLTIEAGGADALSIKDGGDLRIYNPDNTGSALLYVDTDGELITQGSFKIDGNLDVNGSYLKLPHITITERNALSAETGMMIYNTEANEINVFIDTAWKSFGVTATAKGLGEPCSDSLSCVSGYCTDGVCCENACGGDCELCNLAGHFGECSTRTADDNFEIITTCYRCNGTSSTRVVSNNDDGINCSGDCTHCSSGSCVNWPNNTQHEGCSSTCYACQSGSCGIADADTDPGNHCSIANCLTGNCKGVVAECDHYTSGVHNCSLLSSCAGCDANGDCTDPSSSIGYQCGTNSMYRCVSDGHCCGWSFQKAQGGNVIFKETYCNWANRGVIGYKVENPHSPPSGDRTPGTGMADTYSSPSSFWMGKWSCNCSF